jgi:3-dehydroquinate dehydratase-1
MDFPFSVRGRQFGGPKPLFCVPLMAASAAELEAMVRAVRESDPDLVEWRADASGELNPAIIQSAAGMLRAQFPGTPIVFTLRHQAEGGRQAMTPEVRQACIAAALTSGLIDFVDIELRSESSALSGLIAQAKAEKVRVILSYHDFNATPDSDILAETIAAMWRQGADMAKVAVMPLLPEDVLRLLLVTLEARRKFPSLSLSTMSMGAMGSVSRVVGFLYGSDMAYASAGVATAPGQLPIAAARSITHSLLAYC